MSRAYVCLTLAVTVLIGAAARFWGIGFGLPYTQARPDETYIIEIPLAFLRGNPPPAYYDYPWLYMLMVSGLYLCYYVWGVVTGAFHNFADLAASWPVHWEPFFLINRCLSAALGTATIVVVYRIGRLLWDEATALTAAFFLSLAFLHVRDSHFGTTDSMMTFLIMAAIALLLTAHLTGRRSSFALAGAVGGLAAATKYDAVLLVAPILTSYIVQVVDSPDRRRAARDPRVLLFGIPFALTFAVGIPFVALDWSRFFRAMGELVDSMKVGSPFLELGNGWLHHLQFSLRYGLGLPLLITGLAGAASMLVSEPRIGVVLLSFPLAYYAVAGALRNLFFRYAIPVVPFLCLTAAWLLWRAVAHVRSRVIGRTLAFPPGWTGATGAALAVALVLPSAKSAWDFDRVICQTDNRVIAARWLSEHAPPGSSVLQSGSAFGHAQLDPGQHYVQWIWERTLLTFVINRRPAVGSPDWILVQESPLPSTTQEVVKEFLKADYTLVQQLQALSLSRDHVFDRQDAFFVPFAGFDEVKRPGPNFLIYKRKSAEAR